MHPGHYDTTDWWIDKRSGYYSFYLNGIEEGRPEKFREWAAETKPEIREILDSGETEYEYFDLKGKAKRQCKRKCKGWYRGKERRQCKRHCRAADEPFTKAEYDQILDPVGAAQQQMIAELGKDEGKGINPLMVGGMALGGLVLIGTLTYLITR